MRRLFVAVPIPEDVSRALARILPEVPALRRVAPELMHITLAFIGWLPDERVESVLDAGREAGTAVGPFEIELARIGRFPEHGAPRAIWVGPDRPVPALGRLGATVRAALARRGIAFDAKPLRAHVTLARVREGTPAADARDIAERAGAPLEPHRRIPVAQLDVFESHLSRSGPRYESLAAVPLAR